MRKWSQNPTPVRLAALCAALVPCSAGAVQQQVRAQPQQGSATAPKVLISVDEAETTAAAQLQRTNSAKKQ